MLSTKVPMKPSWILTAHQFCIAPVEAYSRTLLDLGGFVYWNCTVCMKSWYQLQNIHPYTHQHPVSRE